MAISRIQWAYEVSKGYGLGSLWVAFSGGKDSVTLLELVKMSGIPHEAHYNITGIDPPELYYFIRDECPDVKMDMYEKSMWQLIVEKGFPPTRLMRYCCAELKERGGAERVCCTGVRNAESVKRRGRKAFEIGTVKKADRVLFNDNDEARRQWEHCTVKGKYICNPIIDWTDADVWNFICGNNVKYCKLYDEGFTRLGCIGCPQGGRYNMQIQFARWPEFRKIYLHAFDRMLANSKDRPRTWKTGWDVITWWMRNRPLPKQLANQIKMELEE
jgi:phosphoadenosine phosphosulfate reductase